MFGRISFVTVLPKTISVPKAAKLFKAVKTLSKIANIAKYILPIKMADVTGMGAEIERKTGFNPLLLAVGIVTLAVGILIYVVTYGATNLAISAMNVTLSSGIQSTINATWQMLAIALMAGGVGMMIWAFLGPFMRR